MPRLWNAMPPAGASLKYRRPELVEGRLAVYANPSMQDYMFHCYLLLCADGSYYCGHTDDMEKRFAEHESGLFKGYTYKRRPVKLVWNEAFQTRDDAKSAEQRIKGWSGAKKEALLAGDWDTISRLAKSRSSNG
jgi:putative endonuclease